MATLQSAPPTSPEMPALSATESAAIFEGVVRRYLKMSTAEFLSRIDYGYFQDHPELAQRLDSVLFYLPLIKR